MRKLYEKAKQDPKEELKWVALTPELRAFFASQVRAMCMQHPDILLHAIVVQKENVLPHIREDANKLYNYMIKLALIDRLAHYEVVTLIPDPRSIKVKSGNSLHDYLQTELWFAKKAITKLITTPMDSKTSLGLQFTDMIAGTVQAHFEDNESTNFMAVSQCVKVTKLFFSS